MTGRYEMFDGHRPATVDVPTSGGENVMVPVIRCVVIETGGRGRILLQRRAEPGEPVLGRLEIPGGRWRAGEAPLAAITREVREETGIELSSVAGIAVTKLDDRRSIATVRPLVVIAGVDGAFPAVHVVLAAEGAGEPRAAPGETADVRWWEPSDLRDAVNQRAGEFIPSTREALRAYFEATESGIGG